MRPEVKGTLAICGSSLGYGTLAILAKLALEAGVEVLPLLAWRFVLGAAVVWLIVLFARRPLPRRGMVLPLLGLGALYATNSLAYMVSLERIPASLATLVFFTYPAVVVLLSRLVLGETLTARRAVSLLLVTVGCGLTVGGGLRGGDPIGILWMLASVAVIAVFIVSSHSVLQRSPGFAGSATILTATALATVAGTAAFGSFAIPPGARVLILIVALGILSTAMPVTLFLAAIRWIGPGRAAIFSTLEPLITVGLAALVLGERLGPGQLFGGALILAGVVWLRLDRDPVPRRVGVPERPQPLEAP